MNQHFDPTHAVAPLKAGPLANMIRHFTPNWFAATMGTGILAVCLGQFPQAPALHAAGEVLWVANIALFTLFSVLYAARWLLYFDEAKRVFGHSVVSMFFGCIPMGLATIINGFLIFGIAPLGQAAVDIAQFLWWADAAAALVCGIAIPFMMFTRQEHSIEQMTAVWLLPVVAAEVAAASGGLLVPHLAVADQMTVLFFSYILWALSVPLAMSILVILVLRMTLHKLPHAGMAATSWLALGPIGTGALGLLLLGNAVPAVLGANGLGALAAAVSGASILAAVLTWGYGLWWMAIAVLVTMKYLREGLPFNLGWWGYTFPLGVYAVATIKLGSLLPIPAIGVFGEILVAVLAVLWVVIAGLTLVGAWTGKLFADPSLQK